MGEMIWYGVMDTIMASIGFEQLGQEKDGTTVWKHHLIDKKISQMHALAWEDLDNDGKPEIISGKRIMPIVGDLCLLS